MIVSVRAAVVGVYHPKWEERPILVIEAKEGVEIDEKIVSDWLAPQIVKWWTPDRILFDTIPMTSTGKIDKKAIRDKYAGILS